MPSIVHQMSLGKVQQRPNKENDKNENKDKFGKAQLSAIVQRAA